MQQTQHQLTLAYRPFNVWLQSVVCMAIAFTVPQFEGYPSRYNLLVSIGLFVVGFWQIAYRGSIVTCSFNKRQGYFVIQQEGLRGTRRLRRSLREVSGIAIDEIVQYGGKRRRGPYVYKIYLQMFSGDRIALSTNALFSQEQAHQTAWMLCRFFGLRPYSMTEAKRRSLLL
ncbi:hypothetical protein [Oculatella sp. LEGE 06141]|uniref:hypothetical protein n=1 Tax=Oculatella sp. LEGE 06141 TaxID=1828648 RepID=UPI001882F910|nr:hypothetical protein [Oculatella sp. LEGE 06141]